MAMAKAVLLNPSKGKTMALKFRKRKKVARNNPTAPRKRRRARRNPAAKTRTKYRTRTVTKIRRIRAKKNPLRRRRTRRNPSGGRGIMRGIRTYAPLVLGVGGGLIAGLFAVRYIPVMVPSRIRGIVPALLGAILASISKSPLLRNVGIGIGAAGVLDLARNNIPMLALSEISTLQDIPALGGTFDETYALGGLGPTMSLGDVDTLGGAPVYAMPSMGDFDTM